MFWVLVIAGSLAGLILLVALLGLLLPRHHTATRRARFNRPVAEVWKAITDIEAFPSWRKELASVERLPDREGRPVWREVGKFGAMTLEAVDMRPPTRLVGRIADNDAAFGGSWTYELSESEGGTLLAITENGEISNPIFRFLSKFVFGHSATLDGYLKALGRKFGEEVVTRA
jgi:uncharacterized protein YndB with AHSA1/START domain